MARLGGEGASHSGYCESGESHRDSPSASRSGVIIVGATAGTIGNAEGVVTATVSYVHTVHVQRSREKEEVNCTWRSGGLLPGLRVTL